MAKANTSSRGIFADERAQLDLGPGFMIASVLITVVVVSAIAAAILPTSFTNLADVNAVFNDPNTTTNDTTTDSILSVFPIILALTFTFGVVGLLVAMFAFRRN